MFQRLPWEWLRYSEAGLDLALQHPFCRRVVKPPPLETVLPMSNKLSVLWVIARPNGD